MDLFITIIEILIFILLSIGLLFVGYWNYLDKKYEYEHTIEGRWGKKWK